MLENYYENKYGKSFYILGIDEVGRGPLCGPEVVCGCVMPNNYQNNMINDSKKLSDLKRKSLFFEILKNCIYLKIVVVKVEEIDKLNIYATTKKAMQEIYLDACLKYKNKLICLTDAMKLEQDEKHPVFSIVKGDSKSINIACASIIAKVIRDNIMDRYDKLYPYLLLSKHKGYPTKKHIEIINKFGINEIYRKTYGPCKKVLGNK